MITNLALLLALTLGAHDTTTLSAVSSAALPAAATLADSQPTPDGWRAFAYECHAFAFARKMQHRGYCTNVYYDCCRGWVCEYFC